MSYTSGLPLRTTVVATSRGRDLEFIALYTTYGGMVLRLAGMLTGDRFVAEEITAEVFARVLPAWRRGQVSTPAAYLRRAVYNEVRSRRRRWMHEQRGAATLRRELASGADVDVDRLALREPLLVALSALPLQQRTILVLRYVEDLSESDVTEILRVSAGTVKSQASRGLAALRRLVEEQS
jgi:RNA polymerase sigma factor (sigma-70 family)